MLSQLLRQLRLRKGLTLEQVAAQLGVTRASVSKWEVGHSRPDHRRIEAIAALYQVSASYLLGLSSLRPLPQHGLRRAFDGVDLSGGQAHGRCAIWLNSWLKSGLKGMTLSSFSA